MTVWILLLRGINVGGAGRLPMAVLREVLEGIGAREVRTLIQSGNAVFVSDLSAAGLAGAIPQAIAARQGFRPAALLRSAAGMRAALDGNPWPEAADDPKPMHLFFHDGGAAPDAAAVERLRAADEAVAEGPGVIYLRAPSGIGRSRLAAQLAKLIGGTVTARNLETCRKLAAMAGETGT